MPATPEQLDRYAQAFNASLTLRYFGVKVSFPSTDVVKVTLDPIPPEHRGGLGTDAVNGGVLAALFDLAIGCTAALVDPTRRSATVQLSMSFMRAVKGPSMTLEARVQRAGGVLVFAEATLFDSTHTACASATGLCRMSELPWADGASPATN
jgi:uncharacterized protein (TIGR00369 family)